jgi:hypothetical protein
MTYDELLQLARRYEGKTLETVTGKRLKVGVYLDCRRLVPRRTAAECLTPRY